MAQSKKVYDNDHSEKPVTRPDLQALEDGGETAKSHKDHSRPAGKEKAKAESPDSIKAQEEEGADSTVTDENEETEEEAGGAAAATGKQSGFYRHEGKHKRRRSKLANKKLAFAAAGGIGLLFGGIMLFFLLIGSLKSVHFATVLRGTGFATTQLVMRKTFSNIAFDAAILDEGNIGRPGRTGRSVFDRIRGINPDKVVRNLANEDRFKLRTNGSGKVTGFRVDSTIVDVDQLSQERFTGRNFDQLSWREKLTVKNATLSQVNAQMADIFAAESSSYRTSFMKSFRNYFSINTSGLATKLREFLGKSPSEAYRLAREYDIDNINQGAFAQSSLDAVNEAADEYRAVEKESVKRNLNQRTSDVTKKAFAKAGVTDIAKFADAASKVSTAVFAMTIYCTARDLDQSIQDINLRKETQAQRVAHQPQTIADEIKAHHINAEATGAEARRWDGGGNVPPATASPFYREATGRDPTKASVAAQDEIPTAKIGANPIHSVYTMLDNALGGYISGFIPGAGQLRDRIINETCPVVLDPVVMTAVAGADTIIAIATAAATGGLTAAVKEGVKAAVVMSLGIYGGNLIGQWLDSLVRSYSGADFTGARTGVDKYNSAAVATNYMNANLGRGNAYGRPENSAESQASQKAAMADMRKRYDSGSWRERYFAIDNPFSLLGQMAAATPAGFDSMAVSTQAGAMSLGSSFLSMMQGRGIFSSIASGLFGGKASAASSQSFMANHNYFGIQQWGWTNEELSRINNDSADGDSFMAIPNADWVEAHVSTEQQAKFEECYAPQEQVKVPDFCTRDFLSTDEALHWRLYKLQGAVIDQLTNMNEITTDEAIASSTSGTGIVGDPFASSVDVPCAPGTKDLGIQDGYRQGSIVKIRICAVPNLPSTGQESHNGYGVIGADGGVVVNSRVSGAVLGMAQAAASAGVNLTAGSGFRTMSHQQSLCPCDGVHVAVPGTSNHQMGLAIDFSGGLPSTPGPIPGNKLWEWLSANAASFGYVNYPREAWHWSVSGH